MKTTFISIALIQLTVLIIVTFREISNIKVDMNEFKQII